MGIPDMALRASLKGNPIIGILATVANAPGVPVTEPFEQPKNDTVNLTCPYGRKNINFKVE